MPIPAPKSALRRVFSNRWLPIGLALCIAAAVELTWVAPLVNRMPEGGVDEAHFASKIRTRDTPDGAWSDASLVGRRVDRTLLHSPDRVVIQGDLYWVKEDGTPFFQNSGIYGVDRRTRANLPGYGEVERTGQFVFPLHTARRDYRLWDLGFVGPRSATFERDDSVGGVAVLVFRFTASDLDETAGYVHLPDVPERYHARTDGSGLLWIEPTSGVVVDHDERGSSFFVEPKTGRRIADFHHWSARYDDATRAAKLQQARDGRRRILATEIVLPAALLLIGLACVAVAAWQLRRPQALAEPAPAS